MLVPSQVGNKKGKKKKETNFDLPLFSLASKKTLLRCDLLSLSRFCWSKPLFVCLKLLFVHLHLLVRSFINASVRSLALAFIGILFLRGTLASKPSTQLRQIWYYTTFLDFWMIYKVVFVFLEIRRLYSIFLRDFYFWEPLSLQNGYPSK